MLWGESLLGIIKLNNIEVALCLSNLGILEMNRKNGTKAINYFEKSKKMLQSNVSENDLKVGEIYNFMGITYSNDGDLKLSEQCFLKSLNILNNVSPSHYSNVLTLINLGGLYIKNRDFNRSLDFFYKARKKYEQI